MIPDRVAIYLYGAPVDMRTSFDGLAVIIEQGAKHDPMSGALYAFINKRKNRLKVLWWDATGYCILYKRLHRALFVRPNVGEGSRNAAVCRIPTDAFATLIRGMIKK